MRDGAARNREETLHGQAEGQARLRHGGGRRHRPGDGARSSRREGAHVIATDLKPELIADLNGRRRRRDRMGSTSATRRRCKRDGGQGRAGRHPVQLRRLRPSRHGADDSRRRTGTSPSTSTSSRCTARSRPSCRACWTRAAARSSTSPRAPRSVRGIPNRYVYGATKAAVIGLTKAVAADFIQQGIRCNAICPGTIQSPSLDDRIADAGARRRASRSRRSARPSSTASRWAGSARPRRSPGSRVYLASDESSYTTGQIHLADGGFAL